MSSKKINPRRRPASQADIIKARAKGQNDALQTALGISVFTLKELNADKEQTHRFVEKFNYISDSIAKGYIFWRDIEQALREEYGIEICLT